MSSTSVVVGIDVAKGHVDVLVLSGRFDAQRFDNEADAYSVLVLALTPLGVCCSWRLPATTRRRGVAH